MHNHCCRKGQKVSLPTADIWADTNLLKMLLDHTLLRREKCIFKVSEASQVREKLHNPLR